MMMNDYQYPAVGAFLNSNTCTFTVWAPQRKRVELIIDNNTSYALHQDSRGYWSIELEDISAGTFYKYRLDNTKEIPDPASCWQPNGVHEASAVVDRAFAWGDVAWKGLSLRDLIIYELHVGTFTAEGTFDGVISKLDHLKMLGVNAIEIMPVAQFPGTRNWGYDGVYPFAVQHSYGGATGLKKLVDAAHRKEIAVLLDVVYNHLGPDGNYFHEYGPYFTDKYKTPWGLAINYDDAWCDGVRHFFWQNALMWLDEFHIDGLRLDAVHAIWDNSANHFIAELNKKVSAVEETTGQKKIVIAEFDLNNPRYISAPSKGGYGLDGQWIDEFHHALRSLLTGDVSGYYEDFGEAQHLEKALRDSYVYTGQYSKHRKKLFGVLPENIPYSHFVVFSQNHDQVGNRMLGDRLTTQVSLEALKLAAATYLLSPHVPMLFMGEEYGEKNPFQYFVSHTDESLIDKVRKGRQEEFSYFAWKGEVPDPQSEETFRNCILSWNLQTNKYNEVIFSYYRFLIAFRKRRKAMQGYERSHVNVFQSKNDVISYERNFENDRILIVLNFRKEIIPYNLPDNLPSKKIFDSSDKEWGGSGSLCTATIIRSQSIEINAESVIIFEL
jgi:maltooligosyltrehalose trehalohydrolase